MKWPTKKLGEVCEINPRRPIGFERANDALTTFVPMSAVAENGDGIVAAEQRPYSVVRKGYTYFADGDVLYAKITPCMQNGKHAVAHGLIDGVGFGSTEFHVLRAHENIISEWIHRFLIQPSILHDARAYFAGSVGQQRVPEEYLAGLEIPLPPLDEQRRIVGKLDAQMKEVEKMRAAVQQRLDAVRALPSSFLRTVFNSPESQTWPMKKLGEIEDQEVVELGRGQVISVIDMRAEQGDYPVYSAAQQNNGEFGRYGKFMFDEELITWSVDGGGKFFYRPKHRYSVTNVCGFLRILRLGELSYRYLYHALDYAHGNLRFDYTHKAHPSVIREQYKVPLPSLDDQRRIVARLDEQMAHANALLRALESQLETINVLPAALLREVFG